MITQITDNLYALCAPTTYSRQGSYNSFLIRGERDLLIDAGNSQGRTKTLAQELAELKVDPDRLDFFSTHMHVDHVGSAAALAGKGSVLYVHEKAEIYRDVSTPLDGYRLCGLPKPVSDKICLGSLSSPLPDNMEVCFVRDGCVLNYGGSELRCIHSPGHAEEHCCLYDVGRKILFSGDAIIKETVSYVPDYCTESSNIVEYMRCLDRLEALDVSLLLPGHGEIEDHYAAVRTIKRLLDADLDRQLSRLSEKPQTVTDILSSRGWDLFSMDAGTVCTFYFRIYALLNHLVKNGRAIRHISVDGVQSFSLL